MPTAPTDRPVIAAFDVDGTLTVRDCVGPFLRRVATTPGLGWGLARRATRVLPALVRRDRDTLKALAAAAAFTGRPLAEVSEHGRRFAEYVSGSWMRSDTLVVLRDHQARGHAVVLVSASFAVYLRPLAEHLGADGVLATELVVDPTQRCTGALAGGNCRGEEKRRRVHRWLAEHHAGRDCVELWAYGDSPGDHALLADADHGVWMGSDRQRPSGLAPA